MSQTIIEIHMGYSGRYSHGAAAGHRAGKWVEKDNLGRLVVMSSSHRIQDGSVVNSGTEVRYVEMTECLDDSWEEFSERTGVQLFALPQKHIDPAWGYEPVFVLESETA